MPNGNKKMTFNSEVPFDTESEGHDQDTHQSSVRSLDTIDIASYMGQATRARRMSAETKEYVERIKDALEDHPNLFNEKEEVPEIKVKQHHTSFCDMINIRIGDLDNFMAFTQTANTSSQTTATDCVHKAMTEYLNDKQRTRRHDFDASEYPEVLIVAPEDYAHVEIMIDCLVRRYLGSKININIDKAFKTSTFIVEVVSAEEAHNIMREFYPHDVLPACNMGVVLRQQRRVQNRFDEDRPESEIFGVATIKTSVTCIPSDDGRRYGGSNGFDLAPVIQLTNMQSRLHHASIMHIMAAAIGNELGERSRWVEGLDCTPDGRNLGYLVPDQNGEATPCTSPEDMIDRIGPDLSATPVMIIDYEIGKFNLPGVREFTNNPVAFNDSLGELFGCTFTDAEPTFLSYTQEIGVVSRKNGNTSIDSRDFDFLTIMATFDSKALDDDAVRKLLFVYEYHEEPLLHDEVMSFLQNASYRRTSRVVHSVVSPSYLREVCDRCVSARTLEMHSDDTSYRRRGLDTDALMRGLTLSRGGRSSRRFNRY